MKEVLTIFLKKGLASNRILVYPPSRWATKWYLDMSIYVNTFVFSRSFTTKIILASRKCYQIMSRELREALSFLPIHKNLMAMIYCISERVLRGISTLVPSKSIFLYLWKLRAMEEMKNWAASSRNSVAVRVCDDGFLTSSLVLRHEVSVFARSDKTIPILKRASLNFGSREIASRYFCSACSRRPCRPPIQRRGKEI